MPTAPATYLGCGRCGAPLPTEVLRTREMAVCPGCSASVMVRVFPTLLRPPQFLSGEQAAEGEAVCFEHARKRAVAACSRCGRFLCRLCSVDFKHETWCPVCFEAGLRMRKVPDLEHRRTLYDSLALLLSTLPMLFVWTVLFTGPAAIFVSIRYWKAPLGLTRRSRWRFVVAALLGLTQIGLFLWFIAFLIITAARGSG